MRRRLPEFDVLVDMARNNPERLERLRRELTEDVIKGAQNEHHKKRLAGLQFRVDLERRRARTPLAATIKISEMMCHSLADLHRSMVTPLVTDESDEDLTPAKILPFGQRATGIKATVAGTVTELSKGPGKAPGKKPPKDPPIE